MKPTPIKLKTTFSRLQLLPDILLNHLDFLTTMVEASKSHSIERKEMYKIKTSISIELYFIIKRKLETRYPNETYTVSLELHQAIMLQNALLHFISSTSDDFKRNAAEIIKNDLNQKIESISTSILN